MYVDYYILNINLHITSGISEGTFLKEKLVTVMQRLSGAQVGIENVLQSFYEGSLLGKTKEAIFNTFFHNIKGLDI